MSKPSEVKKVQTTGKDTKGKQTLKETAEINKDISKQQSSATTTATSEEIKEKQGIANKYISHQILAEPIRVVSPEFIINAAIAAVNVLGQAIVNPIKDKLEAVAGVSQEPSNINNDQAKDCIDKIGKKCATIAETQAKNAELANGTLFNVAPNTAIFTSNALHFTADTSTLMVSPYTGVTSQDISFTGNNSITNVTDFKLGNYKQKADFIEGLKLSQSQTSLKVATNSLEEVSKVSSYTGVESITTMGKSNSVIADNTLLAMSGGNTTNVSYGDTITQANGNIAILSTKTNTDTKVAASGEDILDQFSNPEPTSISIINTSSDFTNMLVMSNQGMLSSTSKSQFSISEGLSVSKGDKGNAVLSNKFTYSGNEKSGVLTIWGRTFIGSFSFPIMDFGVATLEGIPGLPTLPTITNEKLDNCIPKKYKETLFPEESKDTSAFDISLFPEGTNDTESFSTETSTETTYTVDSLPIPSANNKLQFPRQSQINSIYDPSTGNFLTGSLPAPAISSVSPGLAGGVGVISSVTASHVFVDKYSTESKDILFDVEFYNGINLNTFIEALEDQSILDEVSLSLQDLNGLITKDFITSFVEKDIPSSLLDIFNYAEFYISLAKEAIEVVDDISIVLKDFTLDQDRVQAILNLIKQYPNVEGQILELVKTAKLGASIGFFGGLNKVINFAKKGINSYRDIAKIPKVIESGNFKDIYTTVKPTLSRVLQGTPISKILDNSNLLDTLLQFGTDITKGNLTKESRDKLLKDTFEKVYNEEIKKVLEKQVSNVLGSQLSSAIPLFKDILCKIRLGCTIKPEEYIDQFSGILFELTGDSNIQKATSIYRDLASIIKSSESGDIMGIIFGGSTNSLLNTILGSDNAGSISKIFNLIKTSIGTYEAIKLLPDLITLMNQYKVPAIEQVGIAINCLDLFNKVKDLINSVKGLSSNKDVASILENAGRLVEASNTIKEIPDNILENLPIDTDEDIDLVEYKRVLNTRLDLNTCFRMPKLNVFQAEIEVLDIESSTIRFSLVNLDLLQTDIRLLPKINDLIQLKIQGFYSNTLKEYLTPYQTDFQYTPSVYTFVISKFNIANNVGLAFYDRAYTSIVLENEEGILYKFNTEAIGTTLSPDIIDAYILA